MVDLGVVVSDGSSKKYASFPRGWKRNISDGITKKSATSARTSVSATSIPKRAILTMSLGANIKNPAHRIKVVKSIALPDVVKLVSKAKP